MNTKENLYTKEFQTTVIKLAESEGIEARPIQEGEKYNVEFKCTDCGEWDQNVSSDGFCLGCFYKHRQNDNDPIEEDDDLPF